MSEPPGFRSREARSFLAGLADPRRVQEEFLRTQVLEPNRTCEFGRQHGFASIETVQDWQQAVPVRKYDAFEPWIDRIVATGEQGLLTTDAVRRFFLTSGSTARPKYIPVTNTLVRNKSRAFAIYWASVFDQHPAAKVGRMVTNFSDSGAPVKAPGSGLPCTSESAYWAGVTRATQLAQRPLIPEAVARIAVSDHRYYAIARILLEEEFAAIMTLNPSTILLLFDKLRQHAEPLLDDVARGGISSDVPVDDEVRAWMAARYRGNPHRAAELQGLRAGGQLFAHDVWPQLELAICWRSPTLRPYLDRLAPDFGPLAQRDYILMASEGIMAIPIEDGCSGGPLALGVHFYEFIPEEEIDRPGPQVLLPHELEQGRTYVVVMTNGSGLYRYDIGDVVRVTGFREQTPCVEFLHRAGATSSLTGEKLTEDQVTSAMTEVAGALGLSIESFTLAPAKDGFPRYAALVELKVTAGREALLRFASRLDRALAEHNIEYGGKRSSQRLGPPELWLVAPGGYEARRQRRLAGGASDSQIKPIHLTRDPDFCEQFEIIERFHAD